MNGADIGVCDILVANATLGALIGGTEQLARCTVGNLPQGQTFPALTVSVNSADAQNVKGSRAPSDYVEVYVMAYAEDAASARVLANAVRDALDGQANVVTKNSVNVSLIWFQDEQWFDDLIADHIIHHYEHRYFVRVKNI